MSLKNCYEKCHVVAVSFTILESTSYSMEKTIWRKKINRKWNLISGIFSRYGASICLHKRIKTYVKWFFELCCMWLIDWLILYWNKKKIYEKPFCTTILTNFYNHIIYYIYFLHKLNSKKYHVSSNILLSDMFPIMMIIIEIVVI